MQCKRNIDLIDSIFGLRTQKQSEKLIRNSEMQITIE